MEKVPCELENNVGLGWMAEEFYKYQLDKSIGSFVQAFCVLIDFFVYFYQLLRRECLSLQL